eukprot:6202355-Pleurochrysis_carterae.AAC.2
MNNNFDVLKRLICELWAGTQGARFVRHFAPQREATLRIFQHKYANLYDHLSGTDSSSYPFGIRPDSIIWVASPHVNRSPQLVLSVVLSIHSVSDMKPRSTHRADAPRLVAPRGP